MTVDYAQLDRGRGVNYWALDPPLRAEVERTVPAEDHGAVADRLEAFGEVVGTTVAENADVVDANGPVLHTYDRHGELVNEVEYHPAHLESERAVYEAGAVADSFRAPPGRAAPLPLLHTLASVYLLSYADIGLACPVAMTAGAALVLERFDDGANEDYRDGLLARDHDELLQGAMFLTEEQGGSDVGAIETVAEPDDGDGYRLTGEKWFCSNVDAEVVLTLARRPDAPAGTDGLSLFLVPRTTREGDRNHLVVRRLKDKLGTTSVPTGEVEFEATEAYLVGEPERGFRYMAEMLNYERLANAFAACGAMGRALLESKRHAADREAFGTTLDGHPLMRRDLVELTVAHEAATAFTFDAGAAYQAAARDGDDRARRLMRALVPVAKLRTARLAVDVASYAMEIQGGNGYVADWVTHRLLRDAQVLPIWEGPENILALDLLRAMATERAHEAVTARVRTYLDAADEPALADLAGTVRDGLDELESGLAAVAERDEDYAELHAKALANLVYDVYTAALLLDEARRDLEDGDGRTALVARRFVDDALRDRPARGVASGERLADEWFDAIARYAPVDPAAVETATAAAD
ncbi:MAG: acyl-CoA dehydrogenase family protein [Halobacteriales archaeon]